MCSKSTPTKETLSKRETQYPLNLPQQHCTKGLTNQSKNRRAPSLPQHKASKLNKNLLRSACNRYAYTLEDNKITQNRRELRKPYEHKHS
jgi:hypothetical protein